MTYPHNRNCIVVLFLTGLFFVTGCARYEYDILRPEAHARHVGSKNFEVLLIEPLEYHLQTSDGRLVMLVYNHTDTAVQLQGGQSYVVSPDGESHSLRNVPIAPGSFIKLILPPLRPRVERRGPSFGIGVGASSGGYHRSGVGVGVGTGIGGDDYYIEDNGQPYWEWPGQSDVRMNMNYQQGEQSFSHEFVFHRKKM